MIADRLLDVLEPLLRLYRRDSSLRGPMLSGTIPGLLFAAGFLLLALSELLSGDAGDAGRLVVGALVVFANWFILGFAAAAVILRLLGHRFR